VLWGLSMASVAYHGIKHIRDPNIEITTLLLFTFATFWVAENVVHVSGVLGTVVFGVQVRLSSLALAPRPALAVQATVYDTHSSSLQHW
jgi:NhaP-type Na+/H+ or K+/H+ antiporter